MQQAHEDDIPPDVSHGGLGALFLPVGLIKDIVYHAPVSCQLLVIEEVLLRDGISIPGHPGGDGADGGAGSGGELLREVATDIFKKGKRENKTRSWWLPMQGIETRTARPAVPKLVACSFPGRLRSFS